jgi:diaminopimelate decarboxylase
MSAQAANPRKKLMFIDPAEFTPKFAWKKSATEKRVEHVYCEGVDLIEVATKFGTPTYLYSNAAIADAYEELDRGLGKTPHTICFAMKSNGNLSILQHLAKMGSGFDIVSGGELEHLGHLGVRGDRIVFSGVGKTRHEIRDALQYSPAGRARRKSRGSTGILLFNIESEAELEVLLEESERHIKCGGKIPSVAIRVNPDVAAGGHPHIATGSHTHKFGLDWPEARRLYLAHKNSKYLQWKGISAHIGSQIVSLNPFRQALKRLASYLLELRKNGVDLKYLDFGGGLAVRYTEERPASRKDYARMIADVVRALGVHLLLEPGRSIIAPAGVLLSRVIYSKRNSRVAFVIIDAAMNDIMRPVLYDAPHPITPVQETGESKAAASNERVDIVGQVCETGDCFLQGWPLGELQSDELVAIWAAGAYGMAQASNYNARCRPAEVLIDGINAKLIRRRETFRDLLRSDVLA